MPEAITCPQCNAPLAPHRFARSIVCPYCGAAVQLDEAAVTAAGFREALRAWNSPASYGVSSWVSVGESHWALDRHIARGDISDVYAGRRARWPTELAIIKLLRDRKDESLFENEWQSLQALHRSTAPGADTFTALLPQPIIHGDLAFGANAGGRANIYRWAGGFRHTFEQVMQAYPQGIPPAPRSGPDAGCWSCLRSSTVRVWRTVRFCRRICSSSGTITACGWWDTAPPARSAKACAPSRSILEPSTRNPNI